MNIYFVYVDTGKVISDFTVESEYKSILKHIQVYRSLGRMDTIYKNEVSLHNVYWFANSNILHRIRVGKAEGDFSDLKVIFVFNNIELPLDNYGRIDNWPDGFLDQDMKYNERLLEAMFKV